MISEIITNDQLQRIAVYVMCLVMATAIHEYGHAFMADRLGDSTPEQEGRLTLNPISHADPIGTLILPIVAAMSGWPPFGWGKPVPTRPARYNRRVSMRGGMALVAVAGPLGNLLLVGVTLALTAIVAKMGWMTHGLAFTLGVFGQVNTVLFIFNLIPVHPLDGGKILAAYLPHRLGYIDDFLLRHGYIIVLVIMLSGLWMPGGGFVGWCLEPAIAVFDAAWQPLLRLT